MKKWKCWVGLEHPWRRNWGWLQGIFVNHWEVMYLLSEWRRRSRFRFEVEMTSKVIRWIWQGNSRGNFRRAVVNLEEVLYSNWKYRLYNQSWIIISTLPLLDTVILGELFISFGFFCVCSFFFFFHFVFTARQNGIIIPHLLQFCFHLPDRFCSFIILWFF